VSLACFSVYLISPFPSHASIDAATRAERGLPEDLIRLCVGIEDPADLLDDLERALLEAGAITLSGDQEQQKYVLTSRANNISRAVEKLAFNHHDLSLEFPLGSGHGREDRELFVSAPGKIILFGEHAVVYGVVSLNHRLCFTKTHPIPEF
jgi:Cys/Met metabolism PLP-dependent enzyme